jgi:hypothetical protein
VNNKYERLLKRVEALENQRLPIEVVFITTDDETGAITQSRPMPPEDPRRQVIVFKTTYLTRQSIISG